MHAQKIEQLYQEIIRGHEEPTIAYVGGRTLQEMCERLGEPLTHDTEGNLIVTEEVYCMIGGEGIFRVE